VTDDVMVVGHMPFMALLASYLVAGDADAEVCYFETAAVACLEGPEGGGPGEWELQWMAGPKLLGMKGIENAVN